MPPGACLIRCRATEPYQLNLTAPPASHNPFRYPSRISASRSSAVGRPPLDNEITFRAAALHPSNRVYDVSLEGKHLIAKAALELADLLLLKTQLGPRVVDVLDRGAPWSAACIYSWLGSSAFLVVAGKAASHSRHLSVPEEE